ncbi:arginine deiminase-related protein [Pigmentibacter sp. JX0631]|uniref:dimethylarginine dimethylaminohydrolase family protein n=1 Tax=Pigmentibacter sp. JX0631 TaxID=2976982 RepID=UPI002468C90B|nr:arginine deiminase-related protein [Pigmentibacter sp. JX0631]WGL59308.1 arginine deiminase-related protein [Pigmentibacter sp. JX0631]
MKKVIRNVSELTISKESLSSMPYANRVMMVSPAYFNVENPINAHMRQSDGSLHKLDKNLAVEQWYNLKATYEKLGFNVFVVDPVDELPDMVFCANQSFPYLDSCGNFNAVLSNMFNDTRNEEVSYINSFLIGQGYETHRIASRTLGYYFESMGDALWLPGYRFILGGYGFRTDKRIYQFLSETTNAPIAIFELKHPKFYHLDTCLSILDDKTALACKDAFTNEGWQLLNKIFPKVVEVPLHEADSPGFACNAHCPDRRHVIIQKNCVQTNSNLKAAGFIPVEVDTSEFIKSGGSVFCMKLMFF